MITDTKELAELFRQTGQAHHEAFAATDGVDPDWAIWYADYLCERLPSGLCPQLTKSRLVFCLVSAEDERQARAPDSDWTEYYARHFWECFRLPKQASTDKLALYHQATCPFCLRVRRVIADLDLDVELREIFENAEYRDELIQARGRATVPVLRITSADGSERWMPESTDIIAYLREVYGEEDAA